jgi:nucleoside-diphosphate kinase
MCIQELMDSCTPVSIPYDCTLCLIKPHIIKSGLTGDIVAAAAEGGFGIAAAHSVHLTPQMAEDLMSVYMGLYPQYAAMIEQLCAGPSLALLITGGPDVVNEFRALVGPLKPEIAKTLRPNTLRARFGTNSTLNAIHCTDLPDDGVMECGFIFETIAGLDVKQSRK